MIKRTLRSLVLGLGLGSAGLGIGAIIANHNQPTLVQKQKDGKYASTPTRKFSIDDTFMNQAEVIAYDRKPDHITLALRFGNRDCIIKEVAPLDNKPDIIEIHENGKMTYRADATNPENFPYTVECLVGDSYRARLQSMRRK